MKKHSIVISLGRYIGEDDTAGPEPGALFNPYPVAEDENLIFGVSKLYKPILSVSGLVCPSKLA